MRKRKDERILKPVHPNAGIAALYKAAILKLVDEMHDSVLYWLRAKYRANEPAIMAMDATPAKELQAAIDEMTRRWNARFNKGSEALARHFARQAYGYSDRTMMRILKDAGFTVQFKMTRAMRDVMAATIEQNVALIRSIPQEHLQKVQGAVMRSVQAGRDLGALTAEIEHQFGVTRRRAALIAKTQNNMATASMTRVRQTEAGIDEAIWLHSHGGKEPRPTHLANTGKRYKVTEGWFDPDPRVRRHIWPGELINCFPGSTKIDFADNVEKAFRHFYCGELTEIITQSGKTLRATPNHPILTTKGWRSIGSLNEGDDVIEISNDTIDAVKFEGHVDNTIPVISEIFRAVAQSWSFEIALGTEFHGDASPDGNIDVVSPASSLSFGRKSVDRQSIEQFCLTGTNYLAFGFRSFFEFSIRSFHSAYRIMCRRRPFSTFFWRSVFHANKHCFAAGSNFTADAFDPSPNDLSLVTELSRQRKQAAPGLMQGIQVVRVIRVERRHFSGHVFNLQTKDGYYSAEGIICHNCRCIPKPIVKGFS